MGFLGYGFTGLTVIVSNALPSVPSFNEDIKRMVRHGIAEAVPWLRIDVGPKPGAPIHAIKADDTLYVSAHLHERISRPLDPISWDDGGTE